MINLSDFQPLSIAKIKKSSSTTGFLLKIFSDKVHAILIEEVTVHGTRYIRVFALVWLIK